MAAPTPNQTLDFTSGYAPQSFPSSLAALQAVFSSAAAPAYAYLCNDAVAGGALAEGSGGPLFAAQSSPKYQLDTPFSTPQTKKYAVEIIDNSSQFQNASTAAFDPANGSLTILVAFRVEHVRPGNSAIIGKYPGGGAGYYVYVDSSDRINVFYTDGTHSSTLTSAQSDYGQGAYHLIAVTFNAAGSVTLYTDEETITQNVPNGFVWSSFTNTSPATLGNASLNTLPLFGSIAYVACFAGTITQAQFNASPSQWVTYGTTSAWPGFTFTPPAPGGVVGLSTYDFRDPLNPRVRKHGRAQLPLGSPIGGGLSMSRSPPAGNRLSQPEDLGGSAWTTNGSGLLVGSHVGPDPGYGYGACLLSKPAPGATPSRRQSLAAQVIQGYIAVSVWLRTTDAQPHLAALTATFNGDGGGQVVTSTVTVNGTWQLVTVVSNFVNYSSGTPIVVDVFPCDPNNPNATGSIQAAMAQVAGFAVGPFSIPPSYSCSSSALGQPGFNFASSPFNPTNGYLRCIYIPVTQPSGAAALIGIPNAGGQGGVNLTLNNSTRSVVATIFNASGTAVYNWSYWDYRAANVLMQRTDAIVSWDTILVSSQGFAGRVRLMIDGCSPSDVLFDPQSSIGWPTGMASAGTIGYDPGGTSPGLYIERIEFGGAPATVSRAAGKSATEQYYGKTLQRIIFLGDSLTAFYDGSHSLLTCLLGRGNCIVENAGYSGNRISTLGGLVQTNLFPNNLESRLPIDVLNQLSTIAIVDIGRNDILFDGETDSTCVARLTDLVAQLVNMGLIVGVNCQTPARNNAFGNYTSLKGQYIINYNAAIKARVIPGISTICDPYAFFDDQTGQFRGGVGGLFSYDGLHLTHGIAGNAGPGADAKGLLEFAGHFQNKPVAPSGPAPQVLSYSPQHASPGAAVTINGKNFGPQVFSVDFAGVPCTPSQFTVNSPMQITAIAPSILVSGPIGVATANGRAFGPVFVTP